MEGRVNRNRVAWDAWWTAYRGPKAIQAAQQTRLRDLVAYARKHSPFYRDLYQHLPEATYSVSSLPIVTKPQLMSHFDDWSTDRAVKKSEVEAFVADHSNVGEYYLDRYVVWETSGSTGVRALFLHDERARAIYSGLSVRSWPGWTYPNALSVAWQIAQRGLRTAILVSTGGYYASSSHWHRMLARNPRLTRSIRLLSVTAPSADLLASLNAFQPTVITTYPTVALTLARQQQAGRLKIKPVFILTTAEMLSQAMRDEVESVFHCVVRDIYGTSEFHSLAVDCGRGWLHYNADWVILEPVDVARRPVPAGQTSHTVLLTNLANRVQPLIRYELGDSIILSGGACTCGSPLPAIRILGRANEVLMFPGGDGSAVPVAPFTLMTPVWSTPGLDGYQIIQKAPLRLALRAVPKPGWDAAPVWHEAAELVRSVLRAQGLPSVEVTWDPEPPRPDPVSGKMRRVFSECAPSDHARSSA